MREDECAFAWIITARSRSGAERNNRISALDPFKLPTYVGLVDESLEQITLNGVVFCLVQIHSCAIYSLPDRCV